jgi:hypothetical protein
MLFHFIISWCFVAVINLATYCGDDSPSGTQTFNSLTNQVTVVFHSDGQSSAYYVNRGFSLRFNASQEGEFMITEMLLINLLILLLH